MYNAPSDAGTMGAKGVVVLTVKFTMGPCPHYKNSCVSPITLVFNLFWIPTTIFYFFVLRPPSNNISIVT